MPRKVWPPSAFSELSRPATAGSVCLDKTKTQMTRPRGGQELYRRALAVAGALVALASTACGSPAAGASSTTAGPVTADSIRSAFQNSTMDNAHFTLHGTVIKNRTYYPITGDGVLQLRPVEALALNVNLQTYIGRGTAKMQELIIDGKIYTRNGTAKWTAQPTTLSPTAITSYEGEEIMSGVAVWHARTTITRTTYDLWIRESDSYILQIKYAGVAGTYTMTFDSYNKSREIAAPKN
jgi:hypothetical protein